MKPVTISKQFADESKAIFNDEGTPWFIVVDGVVVGVYKGRAQARKANKEQDFKGSVAKGSELKFEVEGDLEEFQEEAATISATPQVDPVAEAQKQGDAAANDAAVADAPKPAAGKIPLVRTSTIEKPCKQVWHIACAMLEEVGGDLSKLRRKDVLTRCVASGIAFYTARTQYQMWLTIQNGGTL